MPSILKRVTISAQQKEKKRQRTVVGAPHLEETLRRNGERKHHDFSVAIITMSTRKLCGIIQSDLVAIITETKKNTQRQTLVHVSFVFISVSDVLPNHQNRTMPTSPNVYTSRLYWTERHCSLSSLSFVKIRCCRAPRISVVKQWSDCNSVLWQSQSEIVGQKYTSFLNRWSSSSTVNVFNPIPLPSSSLASIFFRFGVFTSNNLSVLAE